MNYQSAVEKSKKYEHLIGKPISPVNPDHMVINKIVIASYNNISKVLSHIYNGMTNEAALILEGMDDELDVFLVYFQSGGINTYTHIDKYLSKSPQHPNQ